MEPMAVFLIPLISSINLKAYVHYDTKTDEDIQVKVGISSVSIEGAKKNLKAENNGWNFNNIKTQTKEMWRKHLAKIDIEGGTERERRIFYTGLYHTAMAPVILNDVDGYYRGVDRKIHKVEGTGDRERRNPS